MIVAEVSELAKLNRPLKLFDIERPPGATTVQLGRCQRSFRENEAGRLAKLRSRAEQFRPERYQVCSGSTEPVAKDDDEFGFLRLVNVLHDPAIEVAKFFKFHYQESFL